MCREFFEYCIGVIKTGWAQYARRFASDLHRVAQGALMLANSGANGGRLKVRRIRTHQEYQDSSGTSRGVIAFKSGKVQRTDGMRPGNAFRSSRVRAVRPRRATIRTLFVAGWRAVAFVLRHRAAIMCSPKGHKPRLTITCLVQR
jgi:hypothetical protein